MLTQDQKNQLEPLTLHPRFGKLLTEAIKAWEVSSPKKGAYGVFFNSDEKGYRFSDEKNHCCCLIGAALYRLQSPIEEGCYSSDATSTYDICENEMTGLINGFDTDENQYGEGKLYTEAYNFGLSVSNICFPNS